jgi:DNA (cytosine-5)-methyltransferase 1
MRLGLEDGGIETCWANDIEPSKADLYRANFSAEDFVLGDVRDVQGREIPSVDIATASFPCIDLSLAGNRRGLGAQAASRDAEGGSSMFWEFARVLDEMDTRRPSAVLLENVLGFASSHGGRDLRGAVLTLNELGYSCDLLAVDARHFVPQSRPRMFIVGLLNATDAVRFDEDLDRPAWAHRFARDNPTAVLHGWPLPPLPRGPSSLARTVERLDHADPRWWSTERVARFLASLSPIQAERARALRRAKRESWRTAYRRTRNGKPVWEIRSDRIAGCLRTARGGSSKQALVEAGEGELRIRWMLPREYARLMGAPRFKLGANRNQALFGFGDAVCVPAIGWLAKHYLAPACSRVPSDRLAVA